MRRLLPLLGVGGVAAAFAAGLHLRGSLGLELSAESIRGLVQGLGWTGMVLFTGLVTFRQFFLLPSALVLTAGGVAFGAGLGTALGALGVALSACMKFGIARVVGRDWVERRYGERLRAFDRRLGRAGPLVVGVATAHPTGPMSPFHWGSGFSSMGAGAFVVAVTLAAPVRAGSLSLFGASVFEPGSPRFLAATAILALVAVAPLLHPGLRRRIFGTDARLASAAGGSRLSPGPGGGR